MPKRLFQAPESVRILLNAQEQRESCGFQILRWQCKRSVTLLALKELQIEAVKMQTRAAESRSVENWSGNQPGVLATVPHA
ncbi:hypothetical protein [Stieleria varia]|uniref:hypothetical protein n=1 Tax=Stieleria varia TaxID=2528005 RepID=UPI0018D228C3|nr:hypothetical protein [Stieleria varia]